MYRKTSVCTRACSCGEYNMMGECVGVDVSPEALAEIKDEGMIKHIADMKDMSMLEDDHFDLVIITLFFHHFLDYGFSPFLDEALRVPQTEIRLFGKPESFVTRRMGVALAYGENVQHARELARRAAACVKPSQE